MRGLLVLSALLMAGCVTQRRSSPTKPDPDRPAAAARWVRTELYFGGIATDSWNTFLAEVVTPRFPAGLTVIEASGQWRGRDSTIHRLPTRILVILHPGTSTTSGAIEEIRSQFKERFHHESVLRADTPASISF
jgi:hypothetical protein